MAGIWSRLRIARTRAGLSVVLVDSLRGSVAGSRGLRQVSIVPEGLPGLDLGVGSQLLERLEELARLATRRGEAVLPLYVSPPSAEREVDWESAVGRVVRDVMPGLNLAVLRHAGSRAARRRLAFPLSVSVDPQLEGVIDAVGVERSTVRLEALELNRWGELERPQLRRSDVVVVPAERLPSLFTHMNAMRVGDRPVLAIGLGPGAEQLTRETPAPPGTAVLGVETGGTSMTVGTIDALLGGQPLHHLVAGPASARGLLATAPELVESLTFEPRLSHPGAGLPGAGPEGRVVRISDEGDLARRGSRRLDLALSTRVGRARRPIPRQSFLESGARYRLHVRIGEPFEHTLFVEAPHALTDLLEEPTAKGWQLQVAVFSADFTVAGPAFRPLRLPRNGASRELTFDLVTPKADVGRVAAARVVVYYRNNAVQAFRVSATVLPSGSARASTPGDLRAVSDAQLRDRIDDLEGVGRRVLSIGTNEDASGASHSVMLKTFSSAGTIPMTDDRAKNLIGDYRAILHDTFWEGLQARFTSVLPGRVLPEFATAIRELAAAGYGLLLDVITYGDDALRADLEQVKQAEGLVLQVTRYVPTFALPWLAVYDWPYTRPRVGADPVPVCTGDCTHTHESEGVICVKGFWGFRHVVEERLSGLTGSVVGSGRRPAARASVALSLDQIDTPARQLMEKIDVLLGAPVDLLPGSEQGLIEALWSADPATGVAIVIGHYEPEGTKPGDPQLPHLQLQLPDQYLTSDLVLEALRDNNTMPAPGPLVLLLGCGTADVDFSTIVGQVEALLASGARAVVGTASAVTSELVCHFASSVAEPLLTRGTRLGEAVRLWRRLLLESGNPLAFSIIPYGDADVSLH